MSDPNRKAEKQRQREEAEERYRQYVANLPPFQVFAKIPRLNRDIVITEKIDGTNAAIGIGEPVGTMHSIDTLEGTVFWPIKGGGQVWAQSRTRIITPEEDNYGFARWVQEHADMLRATLGPGLHFGEWWGKGINRGYGLNEKRFSLFNIAKWEDDQASKDSLAAARDAGVSIDTVPVLYRGGWITGIMHEHPGEFAPQLYLEYLKNSPMGSPASPGFMQPEGIVVFHKAGGVLFKATIENDEKHKFEV